MPTQVRIIFRALFVITVAVFCLPFFSCNICVIFEVFIFIFVLFVFPAKIFLWLLLYFDASLFDYRQQSLGSTISNQKGIRWNPFQNLVFGSIRRCDFDPSQTHLCLKIVVEFKIECILIFLKTDFYSKLGFQERFPCIIFGTTTIC